MTLTERLVARTTFVGECCVWTGATDAHGYGRIAVDHRNRLVHDVAYRLLVGPVPDGHELDHVCRVPACWNPAHVEPVTHRENVMRGRSPSAEGARRTHCLYGHPFDPANTFVTARGTRECKACRNERRRRYRAEHGR